MIVPHRPLLFLAALPIVFSLGLFVVPQGWPIVLGVDALIVGLAFADAFSMPSKRRLSAERECQTILSLNQPCVVTLRIESRAKRPLKVVVRDDRLESLVHEPAEQAFEISARSRAVVEYRLLPKRRGQYELENVYLSTLSRLGLWRRVFHLPAKTLLRVYPDLRQISRYGLLARTNRLSLIGMRKARRAGGDNEFERLRDYTTDDNPKYIDWRATGRRRKLVVRDYQANRSQRIVFMIDAGRMMVNRTGGMAMLDYSLDAMLMLAHVAASQHDEVGILTFSDRVHHWLPPSSKPRQINAIIQTVHNLFPAMVESRYDTAFLHLDARCRKRTLAILVTNVLDEVNGRQIERYVANIAGRHLPLAVLLRERSLFEAVKLPTGLESVASTTSGSQIDPVFRAAAAVDILDWRDGVLRNLKRSGALTLDVFPEDLTAPLVNEYLRIKARHLL